MLDASRQLWNFYDALYLAWKWGSNPAKPEKKIAQQVGYGILVARGGIEPGP